MRNTYGDAIKMMVQDDPRLILKQASIKELLQTVNLSTLPADFYPTIQKFLSNLEGEDKTKMSAVFHGLLFSRKNKICRLAEALNHDVEIREKMTTEERAYFDEIAVATVNFMKTVEAKGQP